MIKVLIVDDERIIRFGITSMIRWNDLGIELVGEASNGEEGLQLFCETTPDIVITDIRMSGMDGIEMMTRIKQIKPEVKFAILSGYQDFSYAKEAIHLGVSDYLLKSDLMPEDIEAILKRMIREIQGADAASGRTSAASGINIKNMLGELCHGIRILSNPDLSAQDAALFDCGYCCLCIGVKKDSFERRGEQTKPLLSELQDQVKEILINYNVMTCLSGDFLEVLVFGSIPRQTEMKDRIAKWIQLLKSQEVAVITVGKSRFHQGIGQIQACYDQACLANNRRLFDGCGKLIEYHESASGDEHRKREGETPVDFDLSKIEKYVEYDDSVKLQNYLEVLFEQLKQQQNYDMVHMVCMEMIVLLNKCADYYFPEEVMFERKQRIYQEYRSKEELNEIACWMKQEFLSILREKAGRTSGSKRVISDVQKYINENYSSDITLLQLSELVHLNKNYLGNLFRKETGQSISEYVIEIRMAKAKELLLHTQLTAKSIAEKVGYEDERYFYKVFKRTTGYTAKDFVKNFK